MPCSLPCPKSTYVYIFVDIVCVVVAVNVILVCRRRTWTMFVDCTKRYTEHCFEESKRKVFNKAVENSIELVHQMCTSTQYQTGYYDRLFYTARGRQGARVCRTRDPTPNGRAVGGEEEETGTRFRTPKVGELKTGRSGHGRCFRGSPGYKYSCTPESHQRFS